MCLLLQEGFGINAPGAGLLGSIVVDCFGQHVPVHVYSVAEDGRRTRIPRFGVAYVSNLAVAGEVRRGGVGRRLLDHAEQVRSQVQRCRQCSTAAMSSAHLTWTWFGVDTQLPVSRVCHPIADRLPLGAPNHTIRWQSCHG